MEYNFHLGIFFLCLMKGCHGFLVLSQFQKVQFHVENNLRCATGCSCDPSCWGYYVKELEPCTYIYVEDVATFCLGLTLVSCYKRRSVPIVTEQPVQPTTIEPATLEPTTIEPATLEPTTMKPTTMKPTTIEPTTLEPTTMKPTTIEPTTNEQTTIQPPSLTKTIEAAFQREESHEVWLLFRSEDTMLRYDDDPDKITDFMNPKGTESRAIYLPDLPADLSSLYFVKGGDKFIFVFLGE